MRAVWLACLAASCSLYGCGSTSEVPSDAAVPPFDAYVSFDAAARDAGAHDGGARDAEVQDEGVVGDASAIDAMRDASDMSPDAAPMTTVCGVALPMRPIAPTPPRVGTREYVLEPLRWGVSIDGSNPVDTTEGINRAIVWAKAEGYARLRLPAGNYLVGTDDRRDYTGGIVLPSAFALVLDAAAVVQMKPTSTPYYCVVRVFGREDVIIAGGRLRGDRDTHTWPTGVSLSGGVVDVEAHGVCVEKQSARVEIRDIVIERMIGDGVLVISDASVEGDLATTDVWIHDVELGHNGRQGVSIVGGERVLIEDSFIHDTNGAKPQFGVDVEGPMRRDRDIVVRRNRFFQNYGGDVINTDGENVWVEDNEFDQGSPSRAQTDGPIGFWQNTSNVIVRNRIRMTRGTANGLLAIYEYSVGPPPRAGLLHIVEDNTLTRAGVLIRGTTPYRVAHNVVEGMFFWSENVACVELVDNQVSNLRPADPSVSWPLSGRTYRFIETFGFAIGNRANGAPRDIPLSLDVPYNF